jgi:hypothetical protein
MSVRGREEIGARCKNDGGSAGRPIQCVLQRRRAHPGCEVYFGAAWLSPTDRRTEYADANGESDISQEFADDATASKEKNHHFGPNVETEELHNHWLFGLKAWKLTARNLVLRF